ncbi:MAG: HlyU family transcriptional regulator [Alphaproteobacteria bacterium]
MSDSDDGKKGVAARIAGFFRGGGAKAPAEAPSESYKGFDITPEPKRQGSGWVTAGIIRKTIGDELKEHRFVRADTHSSREDADAFSIRKAQQIIDEQDVKLFKS